MSLMPRGWVGEAREPLFKNLAASVLAAATLATGAAAVTVDNVAAGLATPTTTISFSEIAVADNASAIDEFEALGVRFSSNLRVNAQGGTWSPTGWATSSRS